MADQQTGIVNRIAESLKSLGIVAHTALEAREISFLEHNFTY